MFGSFDVLIPYTTPVTFSIAIQLLVTLGIWQFQHATFQSNFFTICYFFTSSFHISGQFLAEHKIRK